MGIQKKVGIGFKHTIIAQGARMIFPNVEMSSNNMSLVLTLYSSISQEKTLCPMMQLVLHKGGWRASVSPTLVESNLTMAGP